MRNFGIALALLLAAGSAGAQGRFEGTVTYRMTMPGGRSMDVTMAQRGNKLRQDSHPPAGQPPMSSIIDTQSGEMTMLMPAQKSYMTMNMKNLPGAPGQPAQPDASGVKVQATGKKETIAGIGCEVFAIENKDGTKVDVCAARGMGFLGSMGGTPGMGPGGINPLSGNPALAKVAKDGFFPLRVVAHDPQGQTMTMEATKVDRAAPAATLFAPPADYKKMDMPGMGPHPGMGPPGAGAPHGMTGPQGPPPSAPPGK